MPKKFRGENTKVTAAKERKKQSNPRSEQSSEEDNWEELDKQVIKKQQRKEKEQIRRQEQLQKKAEVKALLEAELKSLGNTKSVGVPKVTRAQIGKTIKSNQQKCEPALSADSIEENLNRISLDEEHASNVDEAIAVLNDKKEVDKHPEKRLKAAHLAYEERRLRELKAENPELRLSKMKEIIFKEWQKSPDNPLNKM